MVIELRVRLTPELRGKFVVLPRDDIAQAVAAIMRRLYGEGRTAVPCDQRDVSDAEPDDVTTWFEALGIDGNVRLYWVRDQEGLEMTSADFAHYWADLCFPGSDDVWITGEDGDWIIEWDHEEIFRLYR